jgi:replicative DNA helicase
MNLPPTNVPDLTSADAERAVLGALILGSEVCLPAVRSFVQPGDFSIVRHRWIYDACLHLAERSMPVDYVTVTEELDKRGQLVELGGPAYVSGLTNAIATPYHAEGYARLVADTSARRGLLRAASEIAKMAYEADGDIDSKIAKALRELMSIRRVNDLTFSASEVASEVYDMIERWNDEPLPADGVRGMSCGIRAIDKMLGGFERKLLYVLAARPSMGKSSLAMQIALNMAHAGLRVCVFSLEMTRHQIVERWMCGMANVRRDDLRRGSVAGDKWPDMAQAMSNISVLPIHLNDSARVTSSQIESEVSRLSPLDLAVVDHLHLVAGNEYRNGDDEVQRVGRVSWVMKQVAKDYNLPMLAVCQLNRGVENRNDKRPILSDLRQSGEIEQNADAVLMLYREDYYRQGEPNYIPTNIAEVLPRKLRDGDTDTMAELYFDKEHTRYAAVQR